MPSCQDKDRAGTASVSVCGSTDSGRDILLSRDNDCYETHLAKNSLRVSLEEAADHFRS